LNGIEEDVIDLYPAIDAAGSAGYYNGGPELGISIMLDGITAKKRSELETLRRRQTELFNREINRIKKEGLKTTKNIQWFDLKNRFSPMGVKTVGLFCEEIAAMDFTDTNKYIAGFQAIPGDIPGFGFLETGQTKVSMRCPKNLAREISVKKTAGIDELLPRAAHVFGGFADACHQSAGAAVIEKGREEALIHEIQAILDTNGGGTHG
jgi:hypothetical protein